MTQQFTWAKASHQLPSDESAIVFFKWHDRGYAGNFSSGAFLADGVFLTEKHYDEVEWLVPVRASPDVEGFIQKVIKEVYGWSPDELYKGEASYIAEFMRQHWPSPIQVTREQAEDWAMEYLPNSDAEWAAIRMFDWLQGKALQSSQPQPQQKRTHWTYDQLVSLLEDVVTVLDLSDEMIEKNGPLGTEPAELVRQVLSRKDLEISALKAQMVPVEKQNQSSQPQPVHNEPKFSEEQVREVIKELGVLSSHNDEWEAMEEIINQLNKQNQLRKY